MTDDTQEPTDSAAFFQDVVDGINAQGEAYRILDQGAEDPEELREALEGPPTDYVKEHDPWDRKFVIWYDGEPARLATNFFDQWCVTPRPREGLAERPNIYAKLVGGNRNIAPGLTYEPAGEKTTAIDLELFPVEGRDDLFHAIPDEAIPVPDITLQVWDIGREEPAIDTARHYEEGELMRVIESGREGTVHGFAGPEVSLEFRSEDEYDLGMYELDEIERIDPADD